MVIIIIVVVVVVGGGVVVVAAAGGVDWASGESVTRSCMILDDDFTGLILYRLFQQIRTIARVGWRGEVRRIHHLLISRQLRGHCVLRVVLQLRKGKFIILVICMPSKAVSEILTMTMLTGVKFRTPFIRA